MKAIRQPGNAWNMLILFWSAFIVFAFLYELLNPEKTEAVRLLRYGDSAACVFFLADVLWRWLASDAKLKFWIWGWIDLLASIPVLPGARLGRLVRVFFIVRAIRGLRSGERLASYFFGGNRVHSTMAVSGILLFGSIFMGCTLLLHYESQDSASPIQTAFDAFWWVITTVTTVGSNAIPATFGGRTVGVFLMLTGITMFGINSALVLNALIHGLSKRRNVDAADVYDEVTALKRALQTRAGAAPDAKNDTTQTPS